MPETKTNAPICKTQTCLKPLTHLKESNCWRCLKCNPIPIYTPTEQTRKKLVDAKMTTDEVRAIVKEEMAGLREIIQDELANWHIQKPPITKDEIVEAVGVGGENIHISVQLPKPETWRQQAKELGIPLNKETGGSRKKVDVLADIETSRSRDTNDSPVTAEKGA